jgi:hypothetical protein
MKWPCHRGLEALGFDQGLAHQAETAPPTKLGGMLLGRLLDSSGCGKDVKLAVGQNAVYVKEEQFDFLGASLGGLVSQSYSLATRKRRLDVALLSATSRNSLDERILTFAAAVKSGNEIFAAQRILNAATLIRVSRPAFLLRGFDCFFFCHCPPPGVFYLWRTFYESLFSGYNILSVFPRFTYRLGPPSRQGLVCPPLRHAH